MTYNNLCTDILKTYIDEWKLYYDNNYFRKYGKILKNHNMFNTLKTKHSGSLKRSHELFILSYIWDESTLRLSSFFRNDSKFITSIFINRKYKAFSTGLEYRSDDCTVALTLANPDVFRQHGTVVLHYLQAVTPWITLGSEIAYLRGSRIAGGRQTMMCAAFRHSTGPTTLSATFGEAGIHVCYHRQASEQLQLGVELETNTRIHESIGTIVYRLDVPYADFIFRGFVNSETSVGAVFEKKLHPIPEASLVISGFLNHKKQQFRVGIGLNIG